MGLFYFLFYYSNLMETNAEISDEYACTNCETPSKKVCYPGDIKSPTVMTPRTLIKCVRVLKKSCQKKDKIIKRLRTEQYRHKKKLSA